MNQNQEPLAVVPTPPNPTPTREWPVMRVAYLVGKPITLVGLSEVVLVPSILSDSPGVEDMLRVSEQFLLSGHEVLTEFPWIIGSTDKDIFGHPRTDSLSHRNGAWDLSPMWNHDHIISPTSSIIGLAWNILNLALLSSITDRSIAFIVEGDHLHVTRSVAPSLLPQGTVISVPTITAWYSVFEAIRRANEITGGLFDVTEWRVFHRGTMSFNPIDRQTFLDQGYLTQPGQSETERAS